MHSHTLVFDLSRAAPGSSPRCLAVDYLLCSFFCLASHRYASVSGLPFAVQAFTSVWPRRPQLCPCCAWLLVHVPTSGLSLAVPASPSVCLGLRAVLCCAKARSWLPVLCWPHRPYDSVWAVLGRVGLPSVCLRCPLPYQMPGLGSLCYASPTAWMARPGLSLAVPAPRPYTSVSGLCLAPCPRACLWATSCNAGLYVRMLPPLPCAWLPVHMLWHLLRLVPRPNALSPAVRGPLSTCLALGAPRRQTGRQLSLATLLHSCPPDLTRYGPSNTFHRR